MKKFKLMFLSAIMASVLACTPVFATQQESSASEEPTVQESSASEEPTVQESSEQESSMSTEELMELLGQQNQQAGPTYLGMTEDQLKGYAVQISEACAKLSDEDIEQNIQYFKDNGKNAFVEAFQSFKTAKENGIGEYREAGDFEILEHSDSLVRTKQIIHFENGDVEFNMSWVYLSVYNAADLYEMNFRLVEEKTSTGEKMKKAGMNTLLGMGTVILVLIFISFIISRFKYIGQLQNHQKPEEAIREIPASQPVSRTQVQEEELADDLELVAVITAAIAAAQGTSTDGFVVRSIKRAQNSKWQRV